jgi:hypothetical protein
VQWAWTFSNENGNVLAMPRRKEELWNPHGPLKPGVPQSQLWLVIAVLVIPFMFKLSL